MSETIPKSRLVARLRKRREQAPEGVMFEDGTTRPDKLCIEAADAIETAEASLASVTAERDAMLKPRPMSEWTEDMGDVLLWHFPIEEHPVTGSPLWEDFDEDWWQWWTPLPDGKAMHEAIRALSTEVSK